MARSREQLRKLEGLIRLADEASKSCTKEFAKAIRELQREIHYLASQVNVAGNADAREHIYEVIEKRMARLNKRLDAIIEKQMYYTGKLAATETGSKMGISVHYSKEKLAETLEAIKARGGHNFAAVLTDKMTSNAIAQLRSSVVSAFNEAAVSGMTQQELAKTIREKWDAASKGSFKFVDRAGRTWDTGNYIMMNVRTNTMHMYNDAVAQTIVQETGGDLAQISEDGGTDEKCEACQEWQGRIVSITGATKGYPTLEQARQAGVFHPNCIHTLETLDPTLDKEEIEEQKGMYV